MPNSLLTGVSGMLAHQRLLDVVGNNIANANTTGFKVQRVLFADAIYETMTGATSGGDGRGGTNPTQIGGGVRIVSTDRKFSQGGLEQTSEQFDVAINGGGFFVVGDGTQNFLTRAGSFKPDGNSVLATSTGLTVQRILGVGDIASDGTGFQVPGDPTIRIPIGASVPGEVTTSVAITGNLDSSKTGDQAEIRATSSPFETSSGPATGATTLNSLSTSNGAFAPGDQILLKGTDADGSPIPTVSIPVSGATTLNDLIASVNGAFSGVTASLDASGHMVVTANDVGESQFNVIFENPVGNAGEINFSQHTVSSVRQTGKEADSVFQTVAIYDARGARHEVELEFEKQDDDTWRMFASIDPAEGSFANNTIDEIIFNDDGSLRTSSDSTLVLNLNGFATPMPLAFNFDDPENPGLTLTHRPTKSNLSPNQDGTGPGSIVSVEIDSDGFINGKSGDGRMLTIAQIAIASVTNPKGLVELRDSLFQTSSNSGDIEIGLAGSGDRGSLRGGQLESSNVDLAFEFTRLIVAQRGFSANARTVTVSEEVLEELTNLIR